MIMKTNANRQMSYTEVSATIIKESEKAYQAEVLYWTKFDQPVKKATMWIPKSCSKAADGKVTEIATFILNKWEEEHRKVIGRHSSYAADKMRINWDMEHKEALMKDEADERAAYKKRIEDTIAKYLPATTKASHTFIAELGMIAYTFGRIWKEEGVDAAACDEFISWGKQVCKKYGELEEPEEYYERAKAFDTDNRKFVLTYVYDSWVFGDFKANY
jgi:hypothetical protein